MDLIIGIASGFLLFWAVFHLKKKGFRSLAHEVLNRAENESLALRSKTELELKKREIDQQREWEKERQKIHREEEKLNLKEQSLDKKNQEFEKREKICLKKTQDLENFQKNLLEQETRIEQELQNLANLTLDEAKETLLKKAKLEIQEETTRWLKQKKEEVEKNAEIDAQKIIATAIGRLAISCTSETTVITARIPNEEMKGRIIGREGKNIRTLEQATGVNIIIDDTPGAVVISGLDPIRMHIAKLAIGELTQDGRIHPSRIEEVVQKSQVKITQEIFQYGEDAALRVGIVNLHPELTTLLGKLHFRHSYGQNVLSHSLEVSYIMGIFAAELGLDIQLAKRIGLLHDIGKAMTHEKDGSHTLLGYETAKKYGEMEKVANGIGCHHREMDPITVEGSLCSAADAISGSRPGARIESVAEYIKRLKNLEELAYEFPGVDKAYALQAGRELRVIVLPDMIDDNGALNLARDLSKKIGQNFSSQGKIKVTVIRERKCTEYAFVY